MSSKRVISGEQALKKYNELKEDGAIILETIVGSHSYGLNVETSDIDKKFVYIDTLENVLTDNVIDQINVTDDYVGYEIGNFIKLLGKQNPNIAEIAFADEKFIQTCSDVFRKYIINKKIDFLSKKVADSYGAYAHSQIAKAQTTSKKFLKDMSGPRKQLIDFSYVLINNKTVPLASFIEKSGYNMDYLAISKLNHARDTYAMFYDEKHTHKYGIFGKNGVDLKLMNLPKDLTFLHNLYINIDGFSVYCKEYKEWHEWNEKKNIQRFVENIENEHNYDRKNMMHCHRLLNMCIEILSGKGININRTHDREYLLGIRYGKETYQDLVDAANKKRELIKTLQTTCCLQDEIDKGALDDILLSIRTEFYNIRVF